MNSAQLLEHFRGQEAEKQLTKLMCMEHHVEPENAEGTFLDTIEKFLNVFIEQRTELLLEQSRSSKLSDDEKLELHELLSL